MDCISSLDALSSSFDVSNSSFVVWRLSSLSRNSFFKAAMRASTSVALRVLVDAAGAAVTFSRRSGAGTSSTMTTNRFVPAAESPPAPAGFTVRLTIMKSPLALTRSPVCRTGTRCVTAL